KIAVTEPLETLSSDIANAFDLQHHGIQVAHPHRLAKVETRRSEESLRSNRELYLGAYLAHQILGLHMNDQFNIHRGVSGIFHLHVISGEPLLVESRFERRPPRGYAGQRLTVREIHAYHQCVPTDCPQKL